MTTLTQPLEISVLSAPLAAIDRRALSQAWYAALGFSKARERAETHGGRTALPASRRDASSAPETQHRQGATASPSPTVVRSRGEGCPRREATVVERRARLPLAQRIERAFAKGTRPRRATLVLDGTRGRVHVMVQSKDGALQLVAVCRRDVRERVARALDEARFALARRGLAANACVREGVPCT